MDSVGTALKMGRRAFRRTSDVGTSSTQWQALRALSFRHISTTIYMYFYRIFCMNCVYELYLFIYALSLFFVFTFIFLSISITICMFLFISILYAFGTQTGEAPEMLDNKWPCVL